ncbi:toxic anion resistance protein [Gryllotalpicola reticulitermitis]|uniref:Toxic anion resistance protein n=1 Tax=Gryllotalpicola reticulitermitis TaxID=1184153 RepID=A0ABV8Q8Z1_9MICO
MSELNLDSPLTPPEGSEPELVLTPPAAVPSVEDDKALGLVPVADDAKNALKERAGSFVSELAALPPSSPDFQRKVDDLTRMGEKEIRSSSELSSTLLARPSTSLAAARSRGESGSAQAEVVRTLQDLRTTVTDLDPSRADLSGGKRWLAILPGGNHLVHYFQRYQSAQKHLDAILTALLSGQDALRKDNAAIDQERSNLWATMGKLAEYATLARALDDNIAARAAAATDQRVADALTSDALFPIRQRREDLATQLAVAVQGYLALDVIRKNNLELIKGVERARTTTIAALRTAVVVAQALADQKLVLDQITALNRTTNALIEGTSERLQQQSAAIHEQAAAPAIGIETLQRAFDSVFATIDAVDSYRSASVANMAATVDALEGQVTRARGYLERSHAQDPSNQGD